jgi:hypothetical protein
MSSSREARLAVVLGAVAVLAIPIAIAAAKVTGAVELLPGLYVAVPVAFVCGAAGIAAYRRARAVVDRSVRRVGSTPVRAARLLTFAGVYFAATGALALGFYGLLHLKS